MSNLNSIFQIVDEFQALIAGITRPAFDFPKYNVSKTDTGYQVQMALAGYDKSELSVKVAQGVIEISGMPSTEKLNANSNLLYRGIAMKPFKVRMAIPFGSPVGDIKFDNGMLSFEFGEKATQTKELPIN